MTEATTSTGAHYVMVDSDPALTAGTIWQYFETAIFSASTPASESALSVPTGAVTIPGGTSVPVNFKVQLDYDNSQCVTGNNCSADVFRATCGTSSSCPNFVKDQTPFTKLAVTTTQTVTAANTHFVSIDTGGTLAYNTTYAYAVRNTFLANSSNPGGAAQISVTTPTGVHKAILNWSNAACRTASPCTLQVYRAVCSSSTNCPAYSAGNSAWTALNMTNGLVPTVGVQGTSWQYSDNDAALTGSTTFVWVATNSYQGAGTVSPASTGWSGTTSVGKEIKVIKVEVK